MLLRLSACPGAPAARCSRLRRPFGFSLYALSPRAFLWLLLTTFIVYWWCCRPRARNLFLLVASVVFFANSNPGLGASGRGDRRLRLPAGAGDPRGAQPMPRVAGASIAAVAVPLGRLAYFEYTNFLVAQAWPLLRIAGVQRRPRVFDIVLPSASRSTPSRPSATSSTSLPRRPRRAPAGRLHALLPALLPPPRRRPHRARRATSSPQLRSRRRPLDRRLGARGALPDRHRHAQEAASSPTSSRRTWSTASSSSPATLHGARVRWRRVVRLRVPDLLRLLRLHRHRHRLGDAARRRASRELRRALPGARTSPTSGAAGTSPLHLAARLPLHPARRQPRPAACDLPQPDAHDAARRPLARRGVDLRGLGRAPRRAPRAASRDPLACMDGACGSASRAGGAHLPARRAYGWVFFRAASARGRRTVLARMWFRPPARHWPPEVCRARGRYPRAGLRRTPCRDLRDVPRVLRTLPAPVLGTVLAGGFLLARLLAPDTGGAFIYFQF